MIAPSAPALTYTESPSPSVEIYFATLHVDVDTITVFRTTDGVTEPVSGAERASVSGDFVVIDAMAAAGVNSYVGRAFDASGASLDSPPATIEVTFADVWVQSVLDPSSAFTIVLREPSLSPMSQSTRNQQVFVAGLRRPFNQFWGEGALQGLPIVTWSESDAEALLLKNVTAWPQMLIRTPASFATLPRLLYATIAQPAHTYLVEADSDARIVWSLIVDETHPMSKAVVRPLITWDDWTTAFPSGTYTWADVMAVYGAGTWTDAIRNPPNA